MVIRDKRGPDNGSQLYLDRRVFIMTRVNDKPTLVGYFVSSREREKGKEHLEDKRKERKKG